LQEPKTLSAAVEIAKSVSKKSVTVNQLNNSSDLSEQVKELQKQVAYLTQLVLAIKSQGQTNRHDFQKTAIRKGFSTNYSRPRNYGETVNKRNPAQLNNNEWKEVQRPSRFVGNAKRCFKCGSFNHFQRNCPKNQHLNYLQPSESNFSPSIPESFESSQSRDDSREIAVICKPYPKREKIVKSTTGSRLCKQFPPDIIALDNFINKNTQETTYASLLKSKKCDVLTTMPVKRSAGDNKPIIKGRISDIPTSLFMDSGAEVNVIDADYLSSLNLTKNFNFEPNNSKSVKCANNTKLHVKGKIVLPISIGVSTQPITFLVVCGVHPKVIIGLRGLKTFGAEIISSNDALKCSGIEIPFIGKTHLDSYHQKNSKMVH